MISFVLPLWQEVLLSALLGALTIGASISLMSTSAYLISMAALHPSIAEIGVAVVGVRFFGISRGVFRYLERLSAHSLTFKVLAKLRVWFYQAIEPLAPARLVSLHSGDLLNRVIADVETLDNLYVRVLAPPLVAIAVITGVTVFMSTFAVVLGATLAAFLMAIGLGLTGLALSLNMKPGRALTDERAQLRANMIDAVQGLPDLTAFGQVKAYLDRIGSAGRRFSALQAKMARLSGLQSGLNTLLTGTGVWLMLYLAIPMVNSGEIKGVYLAVIVLGALASFEAVQNLPQAAQLLESNLQSARRLFEIADTVPAISQPTNPLPRPASASLQIHKLRFAYETEEVLKGIDLELPEGKKVAIVGPSGAGKSTIVNLLMRFWEFCDGEILLDGEDIRRYAPVDARRMFSLVSQETYLFNASLRENLLMANPQASQADIETACIQAELHEFISGLPKGYDTLVGERGAQLSGGERQRMAIARALLKAADLFIFDEPTANLDTITEQRLLATLQRIMGSRSVLWITHRLVGLEMMDDILVMETGRVVEHGTHAELLAKKGLYSKLWELQNQALLAC